LPVSEVPMEYDEDRELTRYVWDHFGRLLTPLEQRVGRAILHRAKADLSPSPGPMEGLHRRLGETGVPEVEAALTGGTEAFRRRVRDRLLREHGQKVFVNRCPRCARVARTPRARQCFWCGFAWHGEQGSGGAHAGV
jgi:hypothetical protein